MSYSFKSFQDTNSNRYSGIVCFLRSSFLIINAPSIPDEHSGNTTKLISTGERAMRERDEYTSINAYPRINTAVHNNPLRHHSCNGTAK
jgi:hypothetical protein